MLPRLGLKTVKGQSSLIRFAKNGTFPVSFNSNLLLPLTSQQQQRLFSSKANQTSHEKNSELKRQLTDKNLQRKYYWLTEEAEELIGKAYQRHKALADSNRSFPPSLSVQDLEAIGKPVHYEPQNIGDRVAEMTVKVLEKVMALFFREKYDHHAVTLETVAAVPGIVGAASRHLRSLRTMKRDHGWINPLQEEAENERMHLLIWMQHTQPNYLERMFVILAQGMYVTFYTAMYAISPKTAHRAVGYLEEAAHRAYTEYLEAVDKGHIKNVPAGTIAKAYYNLPDDATLRDVILHVRGDECMHRDFNHHLANLYANKQQDEYPAFMKSDKSHHRTTTC